MAKKKLLQKISAEGKSLCKVLKNDFLKNNLEEYKALVRDGKYVCKKCGRVAGHKKNLCKEEAL